MFESDGGFWSAVSSIVETTKRPVIMTALGGSGLVHGAVYDLSVVLFILR